jgi:mannonate dehydratase
MTTIDQTNGDGMHVGVQYLHTTKHDLQFLRRHGVTHMDATPDDFELDTLQQHRDEAAAEGVRLEMIHVPIPKSIPLAQDPQRDRDIEELHRIIENAGKAGLRGLNYNFYVGTPARTAATAGRGGCSYSTFKIAEYDNETLTEAGVVGRDEVFERIGYFIERVIPAATENRVQFACHLDDPPAPVLRGVERWNYPVFDGLKRFIGLNDSPYHGFNFCCGVASEGLEAPGSELYEIVRYFAERQRIFNIHFRNIKGGLHDFREVWPDEGDVDMIRVAQTLYEAGYPYMLMPDHAPSHPDDQPAAGGSERVRQAWAFQLGYIIAVIQAVKKAAGKAA